MTALVRMEARKVLQLTSVRGAAVVLAAFPWLWAYAPGIFDVYGVAIVSGFQVPGLGLTSAMTFLMPLIVAIVAAELVGVEVTHGTLPTVLLRPVTRSAWLAAKMTVVAAVPVAALGWFFAASLVAGAAYGFEAFVGGTGVGPGGLAGVGTLAPGAAWAELLGAYAWAAASLLPVALLAVLATVLTMNAASGALATLATLIVMDLLVILPGLEPYLLTRHLSAYVDPVAGPGWVAALIALYGAAFAAAAVLVFERKDF